MNEKYLPIGTVVTLKEATKKIMITGYFPMMEDKKIFDYNACTFPEGILLADKTLAFNHDQIATIDHMGLANEESENFNKELKDMIKGMEELKNIKLPEEQATSQTAIQKESNDEATNETETIDF